jgi:hypothetical protein
MRLTLQSTSPNFVLFLYFPSTRPTGELREIAYQGTGIRTDVTLLSSHAWPHGTGSNLAFGSVDFAFFQYVV